MWKDEEIWPKTGFYVLCLHFRSKIGDNLVVYKAKKAFIIVFHIKNRVFSTFCNGNAVDKNLKIPL